MCDTSSELKYDLMQCSLFLGGYYLYQSPAGSVLVTHSFHMPCTSVQNSYTLPLIAQEKYRAVYHLGVPGLFGPSNHSVVKQ